eukprot:jgi/Orpsp1_1/1178515/evm.model.c7180000065634.2
MKKYLYYTILKLDEAFNYNQNDVLDKIRSGNTLFARTWQLDNNYFDDFIGINVIPGEQEGISASSMRIFTISVSKYVNSNNKDAAYKVIEFFSSLEIQKMLVTEYNKLSGISSIYENTSDNNVCQKVDCSLLNKLQFVDKQVFHISDYIKYSENFKNIIFEYLNDNITVEETISKIDDITRPHYIKSNSILGKFIVITTTVTIIFICIFFFFIFNNRYYKKMEFLSKKEWFIFTLGAIIMLTYCYTNVGEIKYYSCFIRPILIFFGFSVNITPIIVNLIINYPKYNKISNYISKRRYLFMLFFILIDIIIYFFYIISPLKSEFYMEQYDDNLSFLRCELNTSSSIAIVIINIVYKLLIIIVSIYLTFIEWNLINFYYYSKKMLIALCFDIFFIIAIVVIHKTDFHDLYYYFSIRFIIIYTWVLIHYSIIYGINIILIYVTPLDNNQVISVPIKNGNENENAVSISTFRSSCAPNLNSVKSNLEGDGEGEREREGENNGAIKTIYYKSNFIARIMGYHYSKRKKTNNNIDELTTTNSNTNTDFSIASEKESFTDVTISTHVRSGISSTDNNNYMNGSINNSSFGNNIYNYTKPNEFKRKYPRNNILNL